MRLTGKFLAAILVTLAVLFAINTYRRVLREAELYDRDLRRNSLVVGTVLAHAYTRAEQLDGTAAADKLLDDPILDRMGLDVDWHELAHLPPEVSLELAHGRAGVIRVDDAPPDGRLDTFIPVKSVTRGAGVLHLIASLKAEREVIHTTLVRSAIDGLILFAFASIVSIILGVVFIARPTRALVAKARRVGAGDRSDPVVLKQHDELGELGYELNLMTDSLSNAEHRLADETQARMAAVDQLRHADRLMTVGKLASGIAHELGTPLNVVEGRARMIQTGDVEGAEVGDSARIIVEQSKRMAQIIRQLLDFARRGGSDKRVGDLRPLAGQARNLLGVAARKDGVELEVDLDSEPVYAKIDDGQILQVLTNLIVNALHATPAGGRVVVSISRSHATPPADIVGNAAIHAVLAVRDTGAGMNAATLDRVFEPFFTTKEVGKGTGLGLAVVYGIVLDHGGWVAVDSSPGRGSTFSVYLPLASEAAISLDVTEPSRRSPTGTDLAASTKQ